MKLLRILPGAILIAQLLSLGSPLNAMAPRNDCTVNCVGSSCTACLSDGNGTWYCGQISHSQAASFCD